jgi:signal transduction histidine kinase
LRPDAPPQTVLQAIGQTAITVLDVRSACAFSLVPGQTFAEALLFDQTGEVFQSALIDCPPLLAGQEGAGAYAIQLPAGSEGPILPVSDELEWLVSAISPRLTNDQRYWIALEAEGQCIGGVVWGGPAGEAQRLSPQIQELSAIASGWSLALRTAQIREEARTLAEQLAEANRQLHNAQNEILRSKTLIMVGEMAAGAAHEMNNPLAIISGRSQLLAAQLSDPRQQSAAKLIYEQSHRLSEMITELMDFARPQPPRPQTISVENLIDGALAQAKNRTDPADRTIERTIQEVPLVRVDVEQVTAALVEVIDNAIQATDAKEGQLMIQAAFDPYSNRVVMTLADNGCGMDEHTVRHAFDPFFSFKPAGRRRGMGLAKSSRWIESSGGSIRLESRREKGTRTLILLPAAAEEVVENSSTARKVAP